MRPNRIPNLPWRVIDGRAVIVHPGTGKVHELNSVAAFLWENANGAQTVEGIASAVAEKFEVTGDAALSDTRAFYSELEFCGLIRWES